MKKWGTIWLWFTGILVGLGLVWRIVSRRQSLPCPPWLDWLLENRYMEAVAGSQTILDRLGLAAGMTLLDVGCGPGRLTLPAAERVGPHGKVVAMDIQAEMLHRLQRRVDASGLTNVQLLHAGTGTGTLKANEYDRAILVTVLGEIPDREAALAEIFYSLKPGGILSVTEVIPDPHYQTPNTVRQLAALVGFEAQHQFGKWPAFTMNFLKPMDGGANH